MKRLVSIAVWSLVSLVAAIAFAVLALHRGEPISAAWILLAAICSYAVGYRFYSKISAERVFALDDATPTPAHVHNDGHDFVPTNKWVVFGHHFAAIAGAGPLVGPILAAQFGYLPGTIWLIVGAVLAGATHDFVVLVASMRRGGKSLGQMAREEVGPLTGWLALVSMLMILVILIAVLAMVVVKALAESPWGTVTIGCTIIIAVIMGVWMRIVRPGRVLEATMIGIVLLFAALWLGRFVNASPTLGPMFTFSEKQIAYAIIVYGFAAAVLPVWVLLAPRDYLSAFVKIGTISLLAIGIFIVLPRIQMPALTSDTPAFAHGGLLGDGKGPVFAGTMFPFAFITIACGAISGFHALISSGTTPKLISKESEARFIGYGSMLMESFVAIMALIAACALTPGLYFVLNSPRAMLGVDAVSAAHVVSSWGFAIRPEDITHLAATLEEKSIIARTGGAPTLAVGMAQIFASFTKGWAGEHAPAFWYHFAIMFEALFILTTVDAGTRVGRFIFQDLLGQFHKPLGSYHHPIGLWGGSLVIVAGWGYFLITGISDPLGGIYILWPLFGIANQVLAAMALSIVTVILFRMNKARWSFLTIAPLAWLVAVTETAGIQKLISTDPKIGFLAQAADCARLARISASPSEVKKYSAMLFNARIDAAMCAVFIGVILIVVVTCARKCVLIARGAR